MELFFELQNKAKRMLMCNYKCGQCIHNIQECKEIKPAVKDTPKFCYYHICEMSNKECISNDSSCKYFEPNADNEIQYRLDIQECLIELVYDELRDKINEIDNKIF